MICRDKVTSGEISPLEVTLCSTYLQGVAHLTDRGPWSETPCTEGVYEHMIRRINPSPSFVPCLCFFFTLLRFSILSCSLILPFLFLSNHYHPSFSIPPLLPSIPSIPLLFLLFLLSDILSLPFLPFSNPPSIPPLNLLISSSLSQAEAQRTSIGHTKPGEMLEKAADQIMACFRLCVSDR